MQTKPILRGWIHQEAFFLSLGACILLVAQTKNHTALVGSIIYSFGLLFCFGVSAIYHRPHWEQKPRALLKKFDHCAIFILIAGSATPVCLLGLPKETGDHLLLVIWTAALIGVFQSIFWAKAPKWFTSLFYICVGALVTPYASELKQSLGQSGLLLILSGGIAYIVGAVFYVLKKPNFKPGVFGYHELFHIMTVIGAALHFIAIYRILI
jgi:hemolysin III